MSRTSGTDGAGGVHVDIGIEGDRVGGEEITGGRGKEEVEVAVSGGDAAEEELGAAGAGGV